MIGQESSQPYFTYNNILEAIGHTPLVRLGALRNHLAPHRDIKLYGKLEALNPGGSIKDRTAKSILQQAMQAGQLKKGDTVIESSSGNMAVGLAQACKYLGLRLIVVVDPLINKQTLKLLSVYGARVDQVKALDGHPSYLEARLARVKALKAAIPNSFWSNQYANPNNPNAHWHTMNEIVSALDGALDYLFVATSTCGTLMGCAEFIQTYRMNTKLIAVDAVGSLIFSDVPKPRKIPGHGAGRKSQLLDSSLVDEVMHISDQECIDGCHTLLGTEALLCGGSSGAVVSAFNAMVPKITDGATCAMIFCDRGERYLNTIYNDAWVAEHFSSNTLNTHV